MMTTRVIPFSLESALRLDKNFSHHWSFENSTSVLGIGYSFYFEYIEQFIIAVNKVLRKKLSAEKRYSDEKIFTDQEMHHAWAHGKLNQHIYPSGYLKTAFIKKLPDFLYGHYKTVYEPLLTQIHENRHLPLDQDMALKDAIRHIAVFESHTCVSSFAFFEHLLNQNRFKKVAFISENPGIVYLLGYHFAEEMEHCEVMHQIFEAVYHEHVHDSPPSSRGALLDRGIEELPLWCAVYADRVMGGDLSLDELLNSAYYQDTSHYRRMIAHDGVTPASPAVKARRSDYISAWDTIYEPYLRHLIQRSLASG